MNEDTKERKDERGNKQEYVIHKGYIKRKEGWKGGQAGICKT